MLSWLDGSTENIVVRLFHNQEDLLGYLWLLCPRLKAADHGLAPQQQQPQQLLLFHLQLLSLSIQLIYMSYLFSLIITAGRSNIYEMCSK